jgi:hypothetical protein
VTTTSDLQEQLIRLLDLAHHQVHFAEAKNGALLTLNFAIVLGLVAVSEDIVTWQWRVFMLAVCCSLGIAGLIAVSSFLPRLSPILDISRATPGNVTFTGDIAKMGAGVFLQELRQKLGVTDGPSGYCVDLADQTYVNARIAETKFRRFSTATRITILGLVMPAGWLSYHMATGSVHIWS